MQRERLDLSNRKVSGGIWLRKPVPALDGLMLEITHSAPGNHPLDSKNIRFLQLAYDDVGNKMLTADQYGDIYLLDFKRNRFRHLQHLSSACTALAFTASDSRPTKYLAGLSDCSLRCGETDTGAVVGCMKGHATPIHSISSHRHGDLAVTTSHETAIIWDLCTFAKLRRLSLRQEIDIVKALFLPMGDMVLTSFRDGSMFAWAFSVHNLQCQFQLPRTQCDTHIYTCLTVSSDVRYVAAGGKNRNVHVFDMEARTLWRLLEVPAVSGAVKQIQFVPNLSLVESNLILAALAQEGVVYFLCAASSLVLFTVGDIDAVPAEGGRVLQFAVSNKGTYLQGLMSSGHIRMYDLDAIAARRSVQRVAASLRSATPSTRRSSSTAAPLTGRLTDSPSCPRRKLRERRRAAFEEVERSPALTYDRKKLAILLRQYGEYPEKYRQPVAWCDNTLFLHHRQPVDVGSVVREAYRMSEAIADSAALNVRAIVDDFEPLTTGEYPLFRHYPTYVEDYTEKQRELYRQQELEYLAKRKEEVALQTSLLQEEALHRQLRELYSAPSGRHNRRANSAHVQDTVL
ncbi:PREDICTED: TBC1 domain family member 31-like [Priapulus caudatus]|uniref:TBC1 domain family member 31-like n=1 Tax=Priapulus caudatus TaxID=37621 RepID=A0ABM1ETV2_PRICU|nr:PREDICTED: TBC1 domain family member 31-like [Priapulus caudatus]